MNHYQSIFQEVYRFYRDGFRSMTLGKTLWKIICIKLLIMFAVLKLFFFQDFLGTKFETEQERADYVFSELTRSEQANSLFSHDKENKND